MWDGREATNQSTEGICLLTHRAGVLKKRLPLHGAMPAASEEDASSVSSSGDEFFDPEEEMR